MRYLILALLVLVGRVEALPKVLFGAKGLDAPLAAETVHTVMGPLVQLQAEDGTVMALQRGAKFLVNDAGQVTLLAGNLRVGPAGLGDVVVRLPQGELKVAPLTAATVTAGPEKSTGKVYRGELVAAERTFRHGEGFELTADGVQGTFYPAAAQAPAVDGAPEDVGAIEPAAGDEGSQEAPQTKEAPALLALAKVETKGVPAEEPVVSEPKVEEPVVVPEPETPPVVMPEPEEPKEEEPPVVVVPEEPVVTPEPEEPVVEVPPVVEPEPETPPVVTPEPEEPKGDDTPVVTLPEEPEEPVVTPEPEEPVVEEPPVVEVPVIQERAGLQAAWSGDVGVVMPTGKGVGKAGTFITETKGGAEGLVEVETSAYVGDSVKLGRGSAEEKDVASDGVAGLGRWVGGELTVVREQMGERVESTVALGERSLHYAWGEKATDVPSGVRVTYSLQAATAPTYTDGRAGEGTFEGSMAVDFARTRNGYGSYHLNGTVTMPQQEVLADGSEVTRQVQYGLSTAPGGGNLAGLYFGNTSNLNVTAPGDAAVCAGGCTGVVNVGMFGNGVSHMGAVYEINPGGAGIGGAALFKKD